MRTTCGSARTRAKKRIMKRAKGYVGGRRKQYQLAMETSMRAGVFAYRDRKNKKREFRALWITRISAAVRERGMRYGEFMHGIIKSGIQLDRKSLSELAIVDPAAFDQIVAKVKSVLA